MFQYELKKKDIKIQNLENENSELVKEIDQLEIEVDFLTDEKCKEIEKFTDKIISQELEITYLKEENIVLTVKVSRFKNGRKILKK
jgi:predicted RNase H-like nuclease (RuvC/YqgF family)